MTNGKIRPKKKLSLVATYDAARTTRNNQRHWSYADYKSADLDANQAVRKQLRMRARYQFNNNSYCKGIVSTMANDTIGTGAKIQINSADDTFSDKVEKDFEAWCKAVGLAEKLRTAASCKIVDGQAFLLLTTNPKIGNAVKLDIQLIDADRVTSDVVSFTDPVVDGMEIDRYGNVISYSVYDKHPTENCLAKLQTIKAKYMIHLFTADRSGQHRGVSQLAPALQLFAQLRDWTQATLTAAQTAACITAFIQTDAPAGGQAEQIEPLETIPLEQGQIMTLPAGWSFSATKAEQPVSTYASFKDEIISEIGRCLNIPYNICKCDSQNASYASSRLDTQIYFKTIKLEQQYIIRNCLERIFEAWLQQYTLNGAVTLPQFEHSFMFQMGMVQHSDPQKLANSQAIQLKNLTTTLSEIYSEKGKDYEKELRQIAYEKKLMQQLGLSFGDVTNSLVNEQGINKQEVQTNEQ